MYVPNFDVCVRLRCRIPRISQNIKIKCIQEPLDTAINFPSYHIVARQYNNCANARIHAWYFKYNDNIIEKYMWQTHTCVCVCLCVLVLCISPTFSAYFVEFMQILLFVPVQIAYRNSFNYNQYLNNNTQAWLHGKVWLCGCVYCLSCV